jgi:hypothetical protein
MFLCGVIPGRWLMPELLTYIVSACVPPRVSQSHSARIILQWKWRGTVANPADFPESATGPQSETDVVALADGKTLLSVTRMDGDGPCHPPEAPGSYSEGGSYRYYYESYSSDGGSTVSGTLPPILLFCCMWRYFGTVAYYLTLR